MQKSLENVYSNILMGVPFLKNLSWEKKNFVETGAKILKKKNYDFFYSKLYFLMSNLNSECFQLSFDVHIVYVGQKL